MNGKDLTLYFPQAVYVASIPAVDLMLRGIYSDLMNRLKVGNIALALNGITPGLQVNYNSIFTGAANLATTVDQFGVLQQGGINEEFAEYLLRRSAVGGDVGHLIYFVQDSDGIWRIGGM